ncbi:acyltransferase [Pseudopedobacter beijingensis]|uniref:Acyltransferase n=1 Tax=Pseudopedobacter beijingensis TaxID=1207056 RepID=A0ABW4IG42_9SPHI
MDIKSKIKQNQRLKKIVHSLIMHPVKTRPRLWVRLLAQPFYIKKGRKSFIYSSVRKDIVPFNPFYLGNKSIIESYSTINNAVGEIIIGDESRIGLGNTIIGPVHIGKKVNLAQGITISGLNHNYENVSVPIADQGVNTNLITIEDDVWIGANSVILAGVKIGTHAIIGAGSIVTKDIPPFSIALGNPARIIKTYDFESKTWIKVSTL